MIGWAEALAQIARLSGLKGYPDPAFRPDAHGELVSALLACSDFDQAKTIVSDWLAENETAPVPKHIRDMISAAAPAPVFTLPNPIDRLMGEHWFYEILTDERIEKAREWCAGPRKDLRAVGEQIIKGAEARRASMSEEAWRRERRKAHLDSEAAEITKSKRKGTS